MANDETKKILLVDDDAFLRDIYSKKFKAESYEVKSFPDVTAALDELKSGYAPDIILSDVIMPNKTAWDFLKEMKQEGLAKESTVILLTNEDSESNVERSKEMGVAGYVIKALLTPSEVVTTVKEIYEANQK